MLLTGYYGCGSGTQIIWLGAVRSRLEHQAKWPAGVSGLNGGVFAGQDDSYVDLIDESAADEPAL